MKKTLTVFFILLFLGLIFVTYDYAHRDREYLVRCNAENTRCSVVALGEYSTLTLSQAYGLQPLNNFTTDAFNQTISKGICRVLDESNPYMGTHIDCLPLRSP